MSEYQNKCVSVYKNLANVATVENVIVTKEDDTSTLHWEAVWSQRDLDRNAKFSYKTTGFLDKLDMKVSKSPHSTEIIGEKIVRISNDKMKRAILREVKIKDVKTQFLEIWQGNRRISSTNLTSKEKHGDVYSNAAFCCLEWSHNDETLLYVAERKKPKTGSYFKETEKYDENVCRGKEYVYHEEWGEQLVGCSHPIVVLFDLKSKAITPLEECLPDDMCASEAIWCKNDKSIVVQGLKVTPLKLGLIYCQNRPSALYEFSIESKTCVALTDTESCVFSPRLTPDGSTVVYLSTKNFGPHQQCAKMMKINLESKTKKVIVDVVNEPSAKACLQFNGLYLGNIPRNCWLDNAIVLSSVCRSNIGVFKVNVETGEVFSLEVSASHQVLCVSDGLIFASCSSPNSLPALMVGYPSGDSVNWVALDNPNQQISLACDIEWKVIQHKPTLVNQNYPGLGFESILLQPNGQKKLKGLIVNPHGGPHITYVTGFDPFTVGFCKLGYAVLRVNYRGSLGFGQNSILSLPGNVGTQDVGDVQQAAVDACEILSIDKSDVYVHGGSHGGFLTLHLIGQFPNFYAGAAVRNPVTNIASMVGLTDIMDWCFCETGLSFVTKDPAQYNYRKMVEMSPINVVNKVKSPLLMMIGSADLRVPPQQGFEYSKFLKSHGGIVKVLKYDENNHPIAEVAAEADCFVNIALWFHNVGPHNSK
uniref:acylaminoacyl-peptidase n=1 Tax=Phallusia mammillata TaxID=59560 RepID=A0A6F9D610_9ASCI|nr:acylamino-acid-releasing enzyme-like [Phallusia mammillata]